MEIICFVIRDLQMHLYLKDKLLACLCVELHKIKIKIVDQSKK